MMDELEAELQRANNKVCHTGHLLNQMTVKVKKPLLSYWVWGAWASKKVPQRQLNCIFKTVKAAFGLIVASLSSY